MNVDFFGRRTFSVVRGHLLLVLTFMLGHLAGARLMAQPLEDDRAVVTSAGLLAGKVVDAAGRPLGGATVAEIVRKRQAFGELKTDVADRDGNVQLEAGQDGPYQFDRMASVRVTLADKRTYEVNVLVEPKVVEIRVPMLAGEKVRGPRDVGAGELAGIVVDEEGKPLAGVDVDVWDWAPGNRTLTNELGIFRIPLLGRDEKVQVRFRKPGYSPETFIRQPTGATDWVVVLGSRTSLRGTILGEDGQPAAGASIRANQGPKYGPGVVFDPIWTETKADEAGKYELFLQPDEYELMVSTPEQGIARLPEQVVSRGHHELDIQLQPGVSFRATLVDAQTGAPISGVRLWNWQHKEYEARSNADGLAIIGGMLPGKFQFQVDAKEYGRWWSAEGSTEWTRRQIDNPQLAWQRNFDGLDFELQARMPAVTIQLEKAVTIRGRVVDPDGNPAAGATVAPALTGTGNSLTGDTRYSVATKQDGTFEVLLPASNDASYNLMAHDGKYQQWRKWANAVLPPMQTKPGQVVENIELKLTRPATVRGRVVDHAGNPAPFAEVRAQAADKLENRYYDPTTRAKKDGSFELKFIRPGEQWIQTAPFYLVAEEAPGPGTRKLLLTGGETVEDVELISGEAPRDLEVRIVP